MKQKNTAKINKQAAIALVAALLLAMAFFFNKRPDETPTPAGKSSPGSFADIRLEAKSAYVFDIASGEALFALNPRAQLPLASLAKIMTITEAIEQMSPQETNAIRKIIDAALVISSNNAASAIAGTAENFINNGKFVRSMNQRAKELKLNQTYFLNETGLDISNGISGAYGSAEDVAKLLAYASKHNPSVFEASAYKNIDEMENTNTDAGSTTQLVLSKTGFTDLAGGNLAVIFDVGLNHPIAVVVLGSSKEGRFSDVDKLVKTAIKYIGEEKTFK